MVVRRQKLCEVDNECTLHFSIVLAICVPKTVKFGRDLTKFWQKQVRSFFGTPYKYSTANTTSVCCNKTRKFFFI